MRKNLLVFCLFVVIMIAMTYPLTFNVTTQVPGFFSTDESYAIVTSAWRIHYLNERHLSIKNNNLISYPFGGEEFVAQPIGYLWFLINYLLAIFTTPVLTYNLQILFNFLLSAFFTYLLVFYLTNNRLAAIFSGIIFGFCPYIVVRSWQHLGETYLWPMPMFIWSFLRLKKQKGCLAMIVFISSLIFSTINFGVTYYTFIIFVLLVAYTAMQGKDNFAFLKRIGLLCLITAVILTPQFFTIFLNLLNPPDNVASAFNPYYRSLNDIFLQSAKPLSYFLPSVVHPLFGDFTSQFAGTQFYGVSFTEHTLYLGWMPLILAVYAVRRWRRGRKIRVQSPPGTVLSTVSSEDYYIGFFIILAVVAWFFSQSPWWQIGSFRVFMPSFFMHKILPVFRAYCRFGIVLMLGVAILAGFGLHFILGRFKNYGKKMVVTMFFSSFVLFEFWNWPPYKVIDVSKFPQVYYWLKEQPGEFAIAEYPLDYYGGNEMYKLYQTKHEKKIINGTRPGSYANKVTNTIKKLSDPKTSGILKWLGVKYVIVHRSEYSNTELIEEIEELNKIHKNPNFKLIKSFLAQECPDKNIMCVQKTGPIDVYLLDAYPVEPSVKDK